MKADQQILLATLNVTCRSLCLVTVDYWNCFRLALASSDTFITMHIILVNNKQVK